MSDLTIPEILECAADYVATHGLRKDGLAGTAPEPCCTEGAIYAAYCSAFATSPRYLDAVGPLLDYLGLDRRSSLFSWNDHPSRTADDVITALLDCAAELRVKNGGRHG